MECPVITQDYGYLGEFTRRHRLGLTVDSRSPKAIADAMTTFALQEDDSLFSREEMRNLTAKHTPEAFGRAFFTALGAGGEA